MNNRLVTLLIAALMLAASGGYLYLYHQDAVKDAVESSGLDEIQDVANQFDEAVSQVTQEVNSARDELESQIGFSADTEQEDIAVNFEVQSESEPEPEPQEEVTIAEEIEVTTEEQEKFLQQIEAFIQEQELQAKITLENIQKVDFGGELNDDGLAARDKKPTQKQAQVEQAPVEESTEDEETEEELADALSQYYWGVRSYYFDDMTGIDNSDFEIDDTRLYAGILYNKPISENWILDTDLRASYEWRHLYTDGPYQHGPFIEIKRLRLLGEFIFGSPYWSMEIGRKRMKSRHGWLYDDNMDMIQLNYDSTLLDMEFGYGTWLWDGLIGTDLTSIDDDQKLEASGTSFYFANGQYQWQKDHYLQLDLLHENFDNPRTLPNGQVNNNKLLTRDSKLYWLKASAYGKSEDDDDEQEYWLDAALVYGDKTTLELQDGLVTGTRDVDVKHGFAIQFGLLGRFENKKYGVGITGAFADAKTSTQTEDNSYVQPVIAGNRRQLLGARNRRYYGELLAPRLQNLKVLSLHAGYAWEQDLWFEMSFHRYWQDQPNTQQFISRLGFNPNGIHSKIGKSLEFYFGGDLSPDSQIELLASVFWGQDAFYLVTQDETAYRVQLLYQVRF